MTNHEKYKKAFSVLQPSPRSLQEVENMARLQKRTKIKTASEVGSGCIVLGGSGIAYAANVGGIQRTVQLWIHGDQTTATLNSSDDGTYTIEYPDEDGSISQSGEGGVALEPDGTERPLTEDEIIQEMNAPDIEYNDDGSVWVYYHDQSIDITNKFDKENVCYVKIADGDETLYLTVKYQNGFSYSNEKYIEPEEFN